MTTRTLRIALLTSTLLAGAAQAQGIGSADQGDGPSPQTTSAQRVDIAGRLGATDLRRAASVAKQIYGRELSAGMFSFLGDSVIDLSGGTGGLEPMQLAVRAVIERGVLEMLSGLYGAPSPAVCLDPANDPLSTQSAKARLAQAAPPVYRQTTQSAPYGRR